MLPSLVAASGIACHLQFPSCDIRRSDASAGLPPRNRFVLGATTLEPHGASSTAPTGRCRSLLAECGKSLQSRQGFGAEERSRFACGRQPVGHGRSDSGDRHGGFLDPPAANAALNLGPSPAGSTRLPQALGRRHEPYVAADGGLRHQPYRSIAWTISSSRLPTVTARLAKLARLTPRLPRTSLKSFWSVVW